MQHPFIHEVKEVVYIESENLVVFIQAEESSGSLRDAIYKNSDGTNPVVAV